VQKLFATDGADSASSGFMVRYRKLADAVLGTGGALENANTSLNNQIKNVTSREDAITQRLTQTEARLRAQYQALDTQMANLTALNNYVTAQIATWNKPAA
jgi:flagellar hook-associated protein 2